MGDEELNFTEEEARCWADDPRNQAHRSGAVASAMIILFVIALVSVIAAMSSGRSASNDGQTQVEALSVR
jgi:hypothetical protein